MPSITVISGQGPGKRIHLNPHETSIGRDQTNGLVLSDPRVSRRHANIIIRDRLTYLIDLDSSSGTFLNGQRIASPAQLRHADRIQVGETILLYEEDSVAMQHQDQAQVARPVHAVPGPQQTTVSPMGPPQLIPANSAQLGNRSGASDTAAFACPVCSNSNVNRLSNIVRSGMSSGALGAGFGMLGGGASYVGGVAGVSKNATHLAKVLAPPKEPRYDYNPFPLMALTVGSLIVIMVLLVLAQKLGDTAADTIVLAIGLALAILGAFTIGPVTRKNKAKHRQAHIRWQEAMVAYDRLFYCDRCDHVYDHVTRQLRRPESAYDLI